MINFKLMLASGVISALIGAMIGYGAGYLALNRHGSSQIHSYNSQSYERLYKHQFIWIGAIAGLLVGMGQSCVQQIKNQQEEEQENSQESN
jgi:membrane protein YqaA with SNARE-associated domain